MPGSRFCELRNCQVLNAVHIGDPIRNMGFCSLNLRLASFRRSTSSKSHALPFSFPHAKSKAKPGSKPKLSLRAAAVTLGGL
jgi:hypothetical protein